jgi:hypothetical protein
MSEIKAKAKEKLTKKEIDKAIREKLTGALSDYRQDLGEKKFTTRIKKASKLFSRSVAKLSKKNTQKNKKATVKKVVPAPSPVMEKE